MKTILVFLLVFFPSLCFAAPPYGNLSLQPLLLSNLLGEISGAGPSAESQARVNLGAAASGVNGDITQLTNLNAPIEWEGSSFLSLVGSSSGWNTLIGVGAGAAKTANDDIDPGSDTFLGYQAGTLDNEPDGRNTYIGWQTGANIEGSIQNTFLGEHAGYTLTEGGSNTFVGADDGRNRTATSSSSTTQSTCVGWAACYQGISGDDVGIGAEALYGTASDAAGNNVAVGYTAMENVTTGSKNVALGYGAMLAAGSSVSNVVIGYNSGAALDASTLNVVIGANTGSKLTAETEDIVIGPNVATTELATGSNDILIGTTSAVDTPASSTSNYLDIGAALIENLGAPTISSGFGTSPSVLAGTSTAAFSIDVGTGGSADSGVIGMGTAAPHGWACSAVDETNPGSSNTVAVPTSTTTITLDNYSRTSGSATAWAASDTIVVGPCVAY